MVFMREIRRAFGLVLFFVSTLVAFVPAFAGPGDYSLRVKAGPSFNLQDWENQGRIGAEFDYDFGYNLGFNMMASFGISDEFRFQLIPAVRYDYLYIGPAALYGIFGAGYGVYKTENALDLRFSTGVKFPLGDRFEFSTDANIFITPAGTPGTPVTFDWLIALGMRFH